MEELKLKKVYLKFLTDRKGGVQIKFGPEKHAGELEEFFKILMIGNSQSILFLSSIVKDQEERESLFHRIGNTYNAILLDAFPDIKDKILEEDAIIAEVDKATEEGINLLTQEEEEEFQKKKEAYQQQLAREFQEMVPVNEKTEKEYKEQIELKLGITYEELIRVRELVQKTTDNKHLNSKDRETLSKLSLIALEKISEEYNFLDLYFNQTFKGEIK